jgi:hypothetical protein
MIAWILLAVLIVAQVLAFRWWLTKEYYPIIFNSWAPLIYSGLLLLDFVLAWVVARLVAPTEAGGLELFIFISVFILVVTILYTIFFQWIIRQDMGEPK